MPGVINKHLWPGSMHGSSSLKLNGFQPFYIFMTFSVCGTPTCGVSTQEFDARCGERVTRSGVTPAAELSVKIVKRDLSVQRCVWIIF